MISTVRYFCALQMSVYTPILPSCKWFESMTKRQIEKMQVIEKVKACCIGHQAVDLGSGCTNQVFKLVYYKYGPNNTSFHDFCHCASYVFISLGSDISWPDWNYAYLFVAIILSSDITAATSSSNARFCYPIPLLLHPPIPELLDKRGNRQGWK